MKPLTKKLIDCILDDEFPSGLAIYVDFGIPTNDPSQVFGAYQWGYKREIFSAEELDNALGDGEKLTELVNRENNPYGKGLIIKTIYDGLIEEEEDEL